MSELWSGRADGRSDSDAETGHPGDDIGTASPLLDGPVDGDWGLPDVPEDEPSGRAAAGVLDRPDEVGPSRQQADREHDLAPAEPLALEGVDDIGAAGSTRSASADTGFSAIDPESGQRSASADAEPTNVVADASAPSDAARHIADHAYDKHVVRKGEYPGIESREQFAALVDRMIDEAAEKKVVEGRTAYWHEELETIVIVNERTPESSTAFRPRTGKEYFDEF